MNIKYFCTDMSAMIRWLKHKHVWQASSADCRREGQNFNAVLGDFLFKSASFNKQKIFLYM